MSEACSNQKKGPIRGPRLPPQQYGISKRSCYLLCKMKAVNATDGPLNTKYLHQTQHRLLCTILLS